MKNKIIAILTALILVATTGSFTAFADDGVDVTAPVINSIKVLNEGSIDAQEGYLTLEIDMVEDGVGVDQLAIWLEGIDCGMGWHAEGDANFMDKKLLFTGTHTINVKIGTNVPNGTYNISSISMEDVSGNSIHYSGSKFVELVGDNSREITVTNSAYKDKSVRLNSFEILNTSDVDAAGNLKVKMSVETKGQFDYIKFTFERKSDGYICESIRYHELFAYWESGTYTFNIPLENKVPVGEISLQSIEFTGHDIQLDNGAGEGGCYNSLYRPSENMMPFKNTTFNVTKSTLITDPIELTDINLKSNVIETPGVLEAELKVNTNGNTFKSIVFGYGHNSGRVIEVFNEVQKVDDNTYTVEIPISPFISDGEMTLRWIQLGKVGIPSGIKSYSNVDGNRVGPDSMSEWDADTQYDDDDNPFFEKGNVTIESAFDITYFGSLSNSNVISKIKELNEGETAVIDCRYTKIAPKALFEAIAGKDITVVFMNVNVQWVFNGKNIKLSRCKDINLKSSLKVVDGETYGFGNDEKVAVMLFQDNGLLPGEVDMRINYAYLAAKYKFKQENMKVSYYKSNKISPVEDNDVDLAEDYYYEYDIDHNSTFVLSKNKSALGTTALRGGAAGMSKISIKWTKCDGNGYYIYRSKTKNGTYKKIKTITKKTITSYTDKNITKGKTYYYKIKPYSKNKTFNKTAKKSKAYALHPKLGAPEPDSFKKNKAKKTMRIGWSKVSDAYKYEIYRSTDAKTYKKIYTTRNNYFTNKNLVSGKSYFYKIKSIHKSNSKYNSDLGPYVGIKY